MNSKKIEAYKTTLKLNDLQKEVLFGLMLGDAHLETQNEGRTYRLKIEQSEKHSEYVFHLYEIFIDWVLTEPQIKNQQSYSKVWFQTLSHASFRFFAQQFYKDKTKIVPKLIHKWLTPRGLAYWYMDDGSIKSSESKGVIFNTQGFALKEVEKLCEVLESNFQLQSKPRKQKEGNQIYVSGHSYEILCDLIQPYIIEEMKYKFPKARLTKMPKE